MAKGNFSNEERAQRLFDRIAHVLFQMWEEDAPSLRHTRLLEGPWIADEMITVGQSRQGSDHREHVVPLACIRDRYIQMLDCGAQVGEISAFLMKYLKIVRISREEQIRIDCELGLKTKMPQDWSFENPEADVFARLREGKVEWE